MTRPSALCRFALEGFTSRTCAWQVAERKLSEMTALERNHRSNDASIQSNMTASAELMGLLSAPAIAADTLASTGYQQDSERMLKLLRSCAFAARKAHDFEAARLWFDGCFALSSATADLLSGANMRLQLDPVCALTTHRAPEPGNHLLFHHLL